MNIDDTSIQTKVKRDETDNARSRPGNNFKWNNTHIIKRVNKVSMKYDKKKLCWLAAEWEKAKT